MATDWDKYIRHEPIVTHGDHDFATAIALLPCIDCGEHHKGGVEIQMRWNTDELNMTWEEARRLAAFINRHDPKGE